MIQFGRFTGSNNAYATCTLPVSFTNAKFCIVATGRSTKQTLHPDRATVLNIVSKSQVNFYRDDYAENGVTWIGIGQYS